MNPNVYNDYTNQTISIPLDKDPIALDIGASTAVAKQLYAFEHGAYNQDILKNQERLIKIDRFYISKYIAQTNILKQIIFFCCLALLGAIFYKRQLISLTVFHFYLVVVFSVMLFYTGVSFYDIYSRDSQNFDEYDFGARTSGEDVSMNKTNSTFDFLFKYSKIPSCNA